MSWENFAGLGLAVYENLRVLDGERPSGGFLSTLGFGNPTAASIDLTVFHYLDASAAGTVEGDRGGVHELGGLTFAEGPTQGIYRALGGSPRRMVRAYPEILQSLNDELLTELDDTGVPFGPGDWTAAYEWHIVMPPGDIVNLGVAVSSRQPARVKGDLDRDGFADIVFRETDTGRTRAWFLQHTEASYPMPTHVGGEHPVAVDDFTGDGVEDIVQRDPLDGLVSFRELSTGTTLPLTGGLTPPLNWKLVAAADFDQDGHADLLWHNTSSRKLVIWRMNGTAKIGALAPSPDSAPAGAWEIVGARDFDADGSIDLLWYNRDSGNVVIWYLDKTLARVGGRVTDPPGVADRNWRLVATADFGRGAGGVWGSPDLLWRNSVTGRLVVWHLDFSARRTQGVFTTPADPGNLMWEVAGPR